ncbi:MAG: hypothetical protein U0P82_13155 [Vicinamibacterales bacterium]
MLYIGHFSFVVDPKSKKKPQAWHGYFTAVAEAKNVEGALRKFETLVSGLDKGSELFVGVKEIFLESCVELKAAPKGAFLAHVALEEGESLGSISTTLPAVNRKYATSYHLEPETLAEDGGFDAEPFVVLKKRAAGKSARSATQAKRGAKK